MAPVAAFVIGAITSIVSGYIGMAAAVMSNVRTTFKCWTEGFTEGLEVAIRGGSIMGFGFCSIGVLVHYCIIMVFCLPFAFEAGDTDNAVSLCEALAGFGLGGSSIALFGRVGGGICTKAAVVGADLSGRSGYRMEEDDPRNPACIADDVGDNVDDIAGMGADLFGSLAESTVAALVFASKGDIATNFSALYFPVLVSSSGILIGMIAMVIVLTLIKSVAKELVDIEAIPMMMLFISTVLETPAVAARGMACLPNEFTVPAGGRAMVLTNWGCVVAVLLGLWAGLLVGLVTEYCASHSCTPVRETAESQV